MPSGSKAHLNIQETSPHRYYTGTNSWFSQSALRSTRAGPKGLLKPRFSHKSPSNYGARGKQRNQTQLNRSLGLYKASAKKHSGLRAVGLEKMSMRDYEERTLQKKSSSKVAFKRCSQRAQEPIFNTETKQPQIVSAAKHSKSVERRGA